MNRDDDSNARKQLERELQQLNETIAGLTRRKAEIEAMLGMNQQSQNPTIFGNYKIIYR